MTVDNAQHYGVDVHALQRFLQRQVSDCGGPIQVSLMHGGRSNLTYAVTDGTSRWVLRRPPLGVLTPTAHDMGREFRVVAALGATGVPVPRAVAYCEDTDVIGVAFSLTSYVDGVVLRDGTDTATLPAGDVRRCAEALVDNLVALHAVNPDRIGLGDFGKPAGYLDRQLRRWREQWDRVATRDLPAVGQLHRRLTDTVPTWSGAAIVHGDYRLDNTIVDRADPGHVRAIVDWEMSTLGDPLADLGLLLVYWNPVCEPVLGVPHAPSANRGFPSGRELAERYARRSGRDLHDLAFYEALSYLKLAVIAEGIHARYLAGQVVGIGFERVGTAVPALLRCGLDVLAGETL